MYSLEIKSQLSRDNPFEGIIESSRLVWTTNKYCNEKDILEVIMASNRYRRRVVVNVGAKFDKEGNIIGDILIKKRSVVNNKDM